MTGFKKFVYRSSLISLIIFIYMVITLLPYIFDSSYYGYFFLVTLLCFLTRIFYLVFSKYQEFKNAFSYHLFLIGTTLYLGILYVKLEVLPFYDDSVINLDYCKSNFFLLGIILITLIINSIWLKDKKRKS